MDLAVDNTGGPNQGVIYVSSSASIGNDVNGLSSEGGVHVFLPSGEYVGVVRTRSATKISPNQGIYVRACGVAVDEGGNLVVGHGEGIRFSWFDKLAVPDWSEPSPTLDPPILESFGSDIAGTCRADVDSAGDVYTTIGTSATASGQLRKFTDPWEVEPNPSEGPWEADIQAPSTQLASGNHVDVTLDGEGNTITFNTAGEFVKVSAENGSPIEQFDVASLLQPAGVARNKATGKVYVTDRSGNEAAKDVTVLSSVVVPDSVTGDFEPLTATTGILDGEVDPAGGGEIETCTLELVNNAKYIINKFTEATSLPCEPAAPLNAPTAIEAEATGLSLEETHYFRVVTTNSNGESVGSIHQFVPHAVIKIETDPATDVAPRSATLNASFEGNGDETEYFFKYGLNEAYGQTTSVQNAGSPAGETELSQPLAGLELETTYHYRVVMTNSVGTSEGEDRTFTTHPAVTGLVTKPATSLDQEDLTLNAEFQGDGLDTHYYFEYGFTNEYENVTAEPPGVDAGVTVGSTNVSSEIHQFNGFRTYHYRVVAENSFGVSYGQDETLVAPDPLEPGIENTKATAVTPTTAMVATDVNPNHWATIYLFEWGETTGYGQELQFSEPIGGLDNENITVARELPGLTPGTVYHFRAVAVNFKGTTNGEDVVFVTPDVPRVDSTLAGAVTKTSAHLGGLVAARGSATTVSFQYGPTTAYGSSTPAVAIGEDLFSHQVDADIAGLAPGTTYHFRIVATNALATTFGPDQTLTTTANPVTPEGAGPGCSRFSKKARQASNRAKRLRRKARKAHGKRAKALRRKARSSAKQARRLSKRAKTCRSTSGGSGQ